MNLPFVFANPWGWLALLGIPAVIAIHCLQQKARVLRISTLFLLERLAQDSREGRRVTWLRTSLPFWLQILCVLLLTWILLDPRWLRTDAVQRVVLVLDSSYSMGAFTADLSSRTGPRLRELASITPRTFWTVLETDPARPTLYEGYDLNALEQKLRQWKPSLPGHDPSRTLGLARTLAPHDALVIFVTDHRVEVPVGVDLLAIGEPLENCGLTGSRLSGKGDALEWQVIVQNYGTETAHRRWWLDFDGQKTTPESFDLAPGHPLTLKGKFPPGVDRLTVCLEADRFTLDDQVPMLRPQPKRLTVDIRGDDATSDLFIKFTQIFPALAAATPGQPSDVAFLVLNPHTLIPETPGSAIIFFNDPDNHVGLQGEPFAVEDDPLNRDLSWQGLVLQPNPPIKPDPRDHVLLWKGNNPVIYLRSLGDNRRQLIFNFNFPTSNATRLPAFVLLAGRFLEEIRAGKIAPESLNAEMAEPLALATHDPGSDIILHQPDGTETTMPARDPLRFTVPGQPGFFTVTQGKETLLTGTAQFADARESNFRDTCSLDTLAARRTQLLTPHTSPETITPLWLALIGLLLILNWAASSPRVT